MKLKKLIVNNQKILKKSFTILYGLFFALLIVVAVVVVFSTFNIPGNIKLYSVLSGSMEPTIHTGSIVLVKPSSEYLKGDVITVSEPNNPKVTVTHRIVEIEVKDGKTTITTKGDANNADDTEKRPLENVLGKVRFTVPLLGFVVSFAKTKEGLLILVIVPSVIIVISELFSIRDETKKLFEERKKRKLTIKEKVEVKIGEEEIKVERWYQKLLKKFNKLFVKK